MTDDSVPIFNAMGLWIAPLPEQDTRAVVELEDYRLVQCEECWAALAFPGRPGWNVDLIKVGAPGGSVFGYIKPHTPTCTAELVVMTKDQGIAIRVPALALVSVRMGPSTSAGRSR